MQVVVTSTSVVREKHQAPRRNDDSFLSFRPTSLYLSEGEI